MYPCRTLSWVNVGKCLATANVVGPKLTNVSMISGYTHLTIHFPNFPQTEIYFLHSTLKRDGQGYTLPMTNSWPLSKVHVPHSVYLPLHYDGDQFTEISVMHLFQI